MIVEVGRRSGWTINWIDVFNTRRRPLVPTMTTLPAAGTGTSNAPPAVSDNDAFNHVLDTVLRRDDSTPLKQALVAAGFTDIPSLVSLADDQINDLKDNKKKLAPSDYNLVKLFIMF